MEGKKHVTNEKGRLRYLFATFSVAIGKGMDVAMFPLLAPTSGKQPCKE